MKLTSLHGLCIRRKLYTSRLIDHFPMLSNYFRGGKTEEDKLLCIFGIAVGLSARKKCTRTVYCTSVFFGHDDQKKVHSDGLLYARHFAASPFGICQCFHFEVLNFSDVCVLCRFKFKISDTCKMQQLCMVTHGHHHCTSSKLSGSATMHPSVRSHTRASFPMMSFFFSKTTVA